MPNTSLLFNKLGNGLGMNNGDEVYRYVRPRCAMFKNSPVGDPAAVASVTMLENDCKLLGEKHSALVGACDT